MTHWIDLKMGSGSPAGAFGGVELHYQVAETLDQLDSGDVIESTWHGGGPLRVALGRQRLRPEVEAALVNLPPLSARRLVVPAGTWPRIDRDIVVELFINAIVPPDDAIFQDASFAKLAREFTAPSEVEPPPYTYSQLEERVTKGKFTVTVLDSSEAIESLAKFVTALSKSSDAFQATFEVRPGAAAGASELVLATADYGKLGEWLKRGES